jgi:SAM-dependent methyltransferase
MLPLRREGTDVLATSTDDPALRHEYRIVAGLPVVVEFESSVLGEGETLARSAATPIERPRYGALATVARRLASPANPKSAENVRRLVALLKETAAEPRVLVVGGGSVGDGMGPLYDDPAIRVVGFDIYGSPHVQFVADAHRIPLPDETFEGVVLQAVLEHVLEPHVVAAEIHRVLKPRGLVYAEIPFLQHVHEGAYDFTRFTESGHRYLFRRFDRIGSGPLDGAGTQLLWSIDFFAKSLFRSRAAGKAAKLAFFWLQHLDRLVPEAFAVDAASGTFFMGRKSGPGIGPKDIIHHYRGAQRAKAPCGAGG